MLKILILVFICAFAITLGLFVIFSDDPNDISLTGYVVKSSERGNLVTSNAVQDDYEETTTENLKEEQVSDGTSAPFEVAVHVTD